MILRRSLPLLFASPLPVAAQGVDSALVRLAEGWFNSLTTLRARFTQVAHNGAVARGTALIWRPGRMRFDYDPPEPTLLIAADGQFFHWDREMRQPTIVPARATPLGVLLRDPITLSGEVTVAETDRQGGLFALVLHRTGAPQEGRITLIFQETPLMLRQWVVVDAQGRSTRVTLHDPELGIRLDPMLFAFNDPRFREALERER
ncbi:MAG: outer membrane lipoprotein carrier protein LolA [Rhodovarius sp.]|nr:outer membrane lipoprotein carrier protein LolA [Rhodovarius sp.]MCX7931278.1 outer membrane lipoprotein carrier protein LolA [Rhodovarius sp.]MDW8315164.1 outer membrane lipoprotein carrier protein LolA [Rhodovarius sp.]